MLNPKIKPLHKNLQEWNPKLNALTSWEIDVNSAGHFVMEFVRSGNKSMRSWKYNSCSYYNLFCALWRYLNAVARCKPCNHLNETFNVIMKTYSQKCTTEKSDTTKIITSRPESNIFWLVFWASIDDNFENIEAFSSNTIGIRRKARPDFYS